MFVLKRGNWNLTKITKKPKPLINYDDLKFKTVERSMFTLIKSPHELSSCAMASTWTILTQLK